MIAQPVSSRQIDWSCGLFTPSNLVEICVPSVGLGYGAKGRKSYAVSGLSVTDAGGGRGAAVGASGYIELASDVDTILSTTKCTMLILRSLTSLSFNASGQQYGYSSGANRVASHLPFTDSIIYWDFGNFSDGDGQLRSPAQTWVVGAVDAIALVAGPKKGREIWRNGVRIARNTAAVATRSTGSGYGFRVGAAAGPAGGQNPEIIYQFILINDEVSDLGIQTWSANPNCVFVSPKSNYLA